MPLKWFRTIIKRRIVKSGDGMESYCSAIIPAAGNSTRMAMGQSKQFLQLLGTPAIVYTLRAFEQAVKIQELILVCRQADKQQLQDCVKMAGVTKPLSYAIGGDTRQQSVMAGVKLVSPKTTHLAIHDGARPLVTPKLINRVIEDALVYQAATLAVPVKDTIKIADPEGFAATTPNRNLLWAVQTPQVFEKTNYMHAMELAVAQGQDYTDDCQLMEQLGVSVHLCLSDYYNMKLTTQEDLIVAQAILNKR